MTAPDPKPLVNPPASATVKATGNRIFRWRVDRVCGLFIPENSTSTHFTRRRAERVAQRWVDRARARERRADRVPVSVY